MEFLNKAKVWLSQNKDVVIKTGAGIIGAIAGALVAGMLSDGMTEQEGDLPEWMLEEDYDTAEADEDADGEEE